MDGMVRRRDGDNENGGIGKALLCCAKSVGISFGGATALMLLIGAAVYRTPDPGLFVLPAALFILFTAALACGYLSAKFWGSKGLIFGLISGAFFLFAVFIISMAMGGTAADTLKFPYSMIARAGVILLSGMGGWLYTYRKREKVHTRHKRANTRKYKKK